MDKSITLRIDEATYARFLAAAKADNRSLANLIETLALRQLEQLEFADEKELREIHGDKELLKDINAGHSDALSGRGRFVD